MQLSVLIPTHRHDMSVFARIAQASSWAGPKLEVIVRDNSGQPAKRALLEQLRTEHCSIVFSEPCGSEVNFSEALRLARGDFVFFVADDDFACDHAVRMLPDKIDEIRSDRSVVGITGRYVLEGKKHSTPIAYPNTDSSDVAARIAGYLNFAPPNLIFYSAIRREVVQKVLSYSRSLPFFFSFQDILVSMLYLLNGKFVDINRLFYLYTLGDWENRDTQQKRDLSFYTASNMDSAINHIHWLLCGFEGGMLITHADADLFPAYPPAQRAFMANMWFSKLRDLNARDVRPVFGSAFGSKAQAFRNKWTMPRGKLSFDEMLDDICSFMDLFSRENSQKYFRYWSSLAESVGA